jgi:hypothetical protein
MRSHPGESGTDRGKRASMRVRRKALTPPPNSPGERLRQRFERYLRAERGLHEKTVACYRLFVNRFIALHCEQRSSAAALTSMAVTDFIRGELAHWAPRTGQTLCTALRSFSEVSLCEKTASPEPGALYPHYSSVETGHAASLSHGQPSANGPTLVRPAHGDRASQLCDSSSLRPPRTPNGLTWRSSTRPPAGRRRG